MDDIAIIEESVELLPEIGILLHAAVVGDPGVCGLTLTQAKMIGLLYHQGDSTISELAAGLSVGLPSISEMVDRLEERQMVVRSADTEDKRRVIVALTVEADEIARRIHDLRRTQVRETLARLPAEDHSTFLKSLRILAEVLKASPTPESQSTS